MNARVSSRRYSLWALFLVVAMLLAPASGMASAQTTSPGWGNGTLTSDEIKALVAQMTVEEENTFIHGSNTTETPCATVWVSSWVTGCQGEAGRIPGVARLGIPPLRLSDGPAGVRLGHQETALPAPVGLAASFDPDLAYTFAATMGRAFRATNQDVWLGPMMNMVNVPTAGRNFETLGEDPYLSGELAVELVKGVQSEGILAQIKHFVDNDFENGRSSTSVMINEQTQREMELAPFEKAVKEGDAASAMCSYNRINDVYACGNELMLKGILKGEWNWDGFVTSDWGATHAPTDLIHGLDMEQSGSNNLGAPVRNAINSGTGTAAVAATNDMPAQPAYTAAEWKAALDEAVVRILTQMNEISLLEGTQFGSHSNGCDPANGVACTPYVPQRPDLQQLQPAEFATAQDIAEKSATLLKNDGSLLPLTNSDLSNLLVMGPTAIAPYIGGGGSAHVIPYDPAIGPYDALVSATGAAIKYVPGYDLDGQLVPSTLLTAPDPAEGYANWTLKPEDAAFANQPGLLRQQVMTATVASGAQPVLYTGADAAADKLDSVVDYTGANTLPAGTAWRWSGTFTAPAAGSTQLKIFVKDQTSSQLFVDGLTTTQRRINIGAYPAWPNNSFASQTQTAKSHDPKAEGLQQATYTVTLTEGQKLHLDLRVITGAAKPSQIQFRWVPVDNQAKSIAAAVEAAKTASKVVIFAYDEGTEGSDRGGNAIYNGLKLPGYQDDLIAAVVAANPKTVVVLNTGDPVWMPWANSVKSILEMWYPGQMGGPATADVLLGKVNPSGKLPVTFPDINAPLGTRFPQDTQPAACADNSQGTTYYGTASGALPGNPGNCPLYPGVYTPGFLGTNLHSYRTINYTDDIFAGVQGNGILQGYRWYDAKGYAPLFPFGHGLSYSNFDYTNLMIKPQKDGTVNISFVIRNKSNVAGATVAQVYVGATKNMPSYAQQAVRALRGFQRVELAARQAARIDMTLDARSFQYWDEQAHGWKFAGGARTISVGESSRDLRLNGTVTPVASK